MSNLQDTAISLEKYFEPYRKNIIGNGQKIITPYGEKEIIYADWTASGRLYRPIEEKLVNQLGPYVANTHTETTTTGTSMTLAYKKAKSIIKKHVNADNNDVFIACGTGMTGAINKLQRLLGLRIPDKAKYFSTIDSKIKPVVFITHMEHHSNQTTWLETIADVVCLNPIDSGTVDIEQLKIELEKYKDREVKIASITSCSNVTGIMTPYHQIAKIMHQHGGLCFVDFACSAPYVNINMHPEDPEEKLDAIFFSPHKFLGGPGTPGVLIFCAELYDNKVPDNPGGGTVTWTNPWGKHKYFENIEDREDGGTPGFLQTIKAALAIQLKEEIGVDNILAREHEMISHVFSELKTLDNLHILAEEFESRLGVISFYIDELHYNLAVKMLNDRFGIQTRGGCSCAGTYGHYLLQVNPDYSKSITDEIDNGVLTNKPGWIRMSINPTMTNIEVDYICQSIKSVANNWREWAKDYEYAPSVNEFYHKNSPTTEKDLVDDWFSSTE